MKIVSWNVNGLKAIIKNRKTTLKGFLDYFNADIICIQETKATSKCTLERIYMLASLMGYNIYLFV